MTFCLGFVVEFASPLNNLKILIGKFFYYCLKFCKIMAQKYSFQTVLMIQALVSW